MPINFAQLDFLSDGYFALQFINVNEVEKSFINFHIDALRLLCEMLKCKTTFLIWIKPLHLDWAINAHKIGGKKTSCYSNYGEKSYIIMPMVSYYAHPTNAIQRISQIILNYMKNLLTNQIQFYRIVWKIAHQKLSQSFITKHTTAIATTKKLC